MTSTLMTPRERVFAAFKHQIPDVVPAYLRNVTVPERYMAHYGVATYEELLSRIDNAIITIETPYLGKLVNPRHCNGWDSSIPIDTRTSAVWGLPEKVGGTYTDSVPRPLAHAESIADVENFAWPSGNEWDFAWTRKNLLAEKKCARLSPSWMPVFSRLCQLFGMEKTMINLYLNRPVIEAALARIDRFYMDYYTNLLTTCGDQLDIFGIGDDFAGNTALLLPPELWRSLIKPLYAKYFDLAKKRNLFTFMHCCGNIVSILPDLIDIGLDAWQTVQTHLPGQSAELIKKEFGRHLTFIGAIDTTNILGVASPDAVRRHVRDQIRILAKGGGYICAPDHTVMAEVPAENFEALYAGCADFRMAGCTS